MSLPNPGQAYMPTLPTNPKVGYGLQPIPNVAQPGYLPYNTNALVPQPVTVPQQPLIQPQQVPAVPQQQPLLNIKPTYQQGLQSQVKQQETLSKEVKDVAPTSPKTTTKPGSPKSMGVKRNLEESKISEDKIVKPNKGGKKTEIANSIQSFIQNLKIKKPKKNVSNDESQAPKARTSDHYQELFKKRQKLRNSVITKEPFQSVKRRTVVVTNIASFPSVLEVHKFIRDNLSAVGLYEGAEVEQIVVPQVDYYGTPKHTGYAQIVLKDVRYISTVIETFTKKIFCERVVNVAQT